MIQAFVDKFMGTEQAIKAELSTWRPSDYNDLVKKVIETVGAEDEYDLPTPKRIHVIDDGDYQGTRLFIIGAGGYQPSKYWAIYVSYGSCSGCDTFQDVNDSWGDKGISDKQVNGNWTMMLHMVQSMKEI